MIKEAFWLFENEKTAIMPKLFFKNTVHQTKSEFRIMHKNGDRYRGAIFADTKLKIQS
ncbi:hypothetical protein [Mucilaginibacter arboris]|uniref:Uncharacterized protein n=1 Tax=Mucilaginibacter arboris TaxID=2682090 RepID=A0A7K1SXM5_9SPHI|nr:hypothetical protein [Mucilaginibacter arboris]MVN22063.1 hypothetical protein [Mucilaginibacter arboris]